MIIPLAVLFLLLGMLANEIAIVTQDVPRLSRMAMAAGAVLYAMSAITLTVAYSRHRSASPTPRAPRTATVERRHPHPRAA